MKFVFYNDTGRRVKIHPATFQGCITKKEPIKHLEEREFILPEGTFAWTKMWDYEEFGLSILVTPMVEKK